MTNFKFTSKRLTAILAPLIVVFSFGCAPAYRCYSGDCVNCKYCPPPPLPQTPYPDCVCHSCAASRYLNTPPPAIDESQPN